MATAWMHTGTERNTGSPIGWRVATSDRLVVLLKPDNAGGGKEPQFKDNVARRRVRRVA